MLTERPEGPTRSSKSPWVIFLGIGAVVLLAFGAMVYDATAGFTLGTIHDLCPQDAGLIEKLRSEDVRVLCDEKTCGFARNSIVIVKIRWDYDRDAYCVHSLTLLDGSLATVEPLLPQFAALKLLNVPGITPYERARHQRAVSATGRLRQSFICDGPGQHLDLGKLRQAGLLPMPFGSIVKSDWGR